MAMQQADVLVKWLGTETEHRRDVVLREGSQSPSLFGRGKPMFRSENPCDTSI